MANGKIELQWACMLRDAIDKMRESLFPEEFEKALKCLKEIRQYANNEEKKIYETLKGGTIK